MGEQNGESKEEVMDEGIGELEMEELVPEWGWRRDKALQYLSELCVPVADVAGRRQLRSASRGLLYFPR